MFQLRRGLLTVGMMAFVTVQGCAVMPKPAVMISELNPKKSKELIEKSTVAENDEVTSIVLSCIVKSINQKTGFKIIGINRNSILPVQIIAKPQRGEGLVVIQILGIKVNKTIGNALSEISLSLALTIFDHSGESIYLRSVTVQKKEALELVELLELTAHNALEEYLQDSDLRAIILRLRFGSLGNIL